MVHQVHGGPTGEQVTNEGTPVTTFREAGEGPAAPAAPETDEVRLPRQAVEDLIAKVKSLTTELDAAQATAQVLTEEGTRKQRIIDRLRVESAWLSKFIELKMPKACLTAIGVEELQKQLGVRLPIHCAACDNQSAEPYWLCDPCVGEAFDSGAKMQEVRRMVDQKTKTMPAPAPPCGHKVPNDIPAGDSWTCTRCGERTLGKSAPAPMKRRPAICYCPCHLATPGMLIAKDSVCYCIEGRMTARMLREELEAVQW